MDASKKMKMDMFEGIFCIVLAIFIIYLTLTQFTIDEYSMGGTFASHSFYPQLIAGIMIFLSILLIVSSLIRKKGATTSISEGATASVSEAKKETARDQDQAGGDLASQREKVSKKIFFGIAILLILYTIFLGLFGYILVTPFFMVIMFRMLKIRKWMNIILLSIVSSGAIYFFFSVVLEVIFPQGRFPLIGM